MKTFANQVVAECGSTNDLAKELVHDRYPEGTFVSSLVQTHGRGRQEHEWISLKGNLYLSMICTPPHARLTWVPHVAGISALQTIRECVVQETQIKLKWPNDLKIGNAKMGGILCELISQSPEPHIVVGIGLNFETAPKNIEIEAVSLKEVYPGLTITLEEFRTALVNRLRSSFNLLKTQSVADLVSIYEKNSLFKKGDPISWLAASGTKEVGTVVGVTGDGSLEVLQKGVSKKLYSEEVTALLKEFDGSLLG